LEKEKYCVFDTTLEIQGILKFCDILTTQSAISLPTVIPDILMTQNAVSLPTVIPPANDIVVSNSFLNDFNGLYRVQDSLKNLYLWYANENGKTIYMHKIQDQWYFDDNLSPEDGIWGYMDSRFRQTPDESFSGGAVPVMRISETWKTNQHMTISTPDINISPSLWNGRLSVLVFFSFLALMVVVATFLCYRAIVWWINYQRLITDRDMQREIEKRVEIEDFFDPIETVSYSSEVDKLRLYMKSSYRKPSHSLPALPNPNRWSTFDICDSEASQNFDGDSGEDLSLREN